jgi:hypothetical protein
VAIIDSKVVGYTVLDYEFYERVSSHIGSVIGIWQSFSIGHGTDVDGSPRIPQKRNRRGLFILLKFSVE